MRIWLVFVAVGMLVLLGCGGTTKIAYISTGDAIYVMDADGTNQTRVTTDKDLASVPCWSNDNKRLAFLSGRDSQWSLVIIDIDGSNETVINLNIIPEVSQDNFELLSLMPGCWRPTSDKIFVVVHFDWEVESEGKIYEVTLKDKVAKFTLDNATVPVWSPKGDRLVFHREHIAQIIKTGDKNLLTKDLTEGYCHSWSPDGDKLVCMAIDRTADEGIIVTMNQDGTEKVDIGVDFVEGTSAAVPNWSPDGNKILFSKSDGESCGIYTVNLDGTEETKLLDREDACIGVYSNP
tara:strand:+ start:322 stop:1197 length:876 start_codon:yes stop_codon:yes gene_type:complete